MAKRAQVKVRKDLTGKKFGRLTVLERAEDIIRSSGISVPTWKCQCDCGNITVVTGNSLITGSTKSCGCLHLEAIRRRKKFNKYDLSGEFGKGYTTKGEEFWFDLEDYEKIKDYYWYENLDGYIVTTKNKKAILLHRLIMDNPTGLLVDHIGGTKTLYDNRKCNLRIANKGQNAINAKPSSKNTSGTTGVWWSKEYNKWVSYIIYNHKRIYLGGYDNKDDAINARREAELKYFGEFAYDNSQKIYESINHL